MYLLYSKKFYQTSSFGFFLHFRLLCEGHQNPEIPLTEKYQTGPKEQLGFESDSTERYFQVNFNSQIFYGFLL